MSPSCPSNTYTIPFEPITNSPGEYLTTQEKFNCHQFEKKRGSRVTAYPSFTSMYQRSSQYVVDRDTFKGLFLVALWMPIKGGESLGRVFVPSLTLS
jgi:hypothetical protein